MSQNEMAKVEVYELTVPQMIRSLEGLKGVLKKAQVHFADRKTDFAVVAQQRLTPDMFPLGKQIQIATDTAKGCVARLMGEKPPVFEDNESTYEQFVSRIDRTIAYLQSARPEQFAKWEEQVIRFPWYPGHHLKGRAFLVQHALPNFYFHCTTAYAILRQHGVLVGKADFLGQQDWLKDT
jgi:hypothetical protein